jgi:CYTH domain-containing protein
MHQPGARVSVEIERKFLLGAEPDWTAVSARPIRRIEFEQVYLRVTEVEEKRIRRRVSEGRVTYEYARLTPARNGVRTVEEVEIDRAEYDRLMAERDDARHVIRKTRTTFPWSDRLYEVDHITDPGSRACWLLEVQVAREDDLVTIPQFLPVVREVTAEPAYRNAHIALG